MGIPFLTQGTHLSSLTAEAVLFALPTETPLLFTQASQVVFAARVVTGKHCDLFACQQPSATTVIKISRDFLITSLLLLLKKVKLCFC